MLNVNTILWYEVENDRSVVLVQTLFTQIAIEFH